MTKEELRYWKSQGFNQKFFEMLEDKKNMYENLVLTMGVVPDTIYNFNRIQAVHSFLTSLLSEDDLIEQFNKLDDKGEEIDG